MPTKPSKRPPTSKHVHDDDTQSLTSVPSLTSSASTADSASVLGESPTKLTSNKLFNPPPPKLGKHSCRHPIVKIVRAQSSHGTLACERCEAKLDQSLLQCNYCGIQQCESCHRLVSPQSESRSEILTSLNFRMRQIEDARLANRKSQAKNLRRRERRLGLRLWDLNMEREMVNKSMDTITNSSKAQVYSPVFNKGIESTGLLEEPTHPRSQPIPQDEDVDEDNDCVPSSPITQGNRNNNVVEARSPFLANILISVHGRFIRHLPYTVNWEGDGYDVSQKLTQMEKLNPENREIRIAWRKLDGQVFTHTYCEDLERSPIGGKTHLPLRRFQKNQEWNECETIYDVLDLARKRLTPSALKLLYGHLAVVIGLNVESASSTQMLQSKYPTTLRQDTGFNLPSVTIHKNTEDSSELASDASTDGGSSSASSSDESTATTKGVAETLKEEVIGKIILAMTEWLRSRFIQMHKSAGEPTASSFGSGSAPSGTSEQPSQGQVQPTPKRKLGDRNNDRDGDDDDDDDNPIAPPYPESDRKGKGKEILRLACPYFKYNPTKYQQWPICPGPGWLNVHRVKEHLYRKHRQARFRCLRCWEHFESEQNYFDHQRAPIPCELGEREPIEGFNADQERQLKSRKKKGHVVSETEKWRAVFQILFPHVPTDDIPSPYYEYGQLTSPTTKAHETLAECEEYVLREMPLRLREILVPEFDRDLQIIEQSLQQRAVECTKAIVATLFQEFRKLQQHDTSPTMMQEPSGSQDHAGPSSSGAELPCLDAMDNHRIIFDSTEFNLDFLLGTDSGLSLFQDVQLEDIPEVPTDPDNYTLKKSDSGYGSNNQEQPDQEAEDSV